MHRFEFVVESPIVTFRGFAPWGFGWAGGLADRVQAVAQETWKSWEMQMQLQQEIRLQNQMIRSETQERQHEQNCESAARRRLIRSFKNQKTIYEYHAREREGSPCEATPKSGSTKKVHFADPASILK